MWVIVLVGVSVVLAVIGDPGNDRSLDSHRAENGEKVLHGFRGLKERWESPLAAGVRWFRVEQRAERIPMHLIPATEKIAFAQSCWHRQIVDECRDSFIAEMERSGVAESQVDLFEVTGAFELPLHAKRLASSGRYSAVVAAGLVVDGGIYRHEFVAEAVIDGLMRVQLDTGVPVISAVLTPHNFHEHETHQSFFAEHFKVKGQEAAHACKHTIEALAELPAAA